MPTQHELEIQRLGEPRFPTPLRGGGFVPEGARIRLEIDCAAAQDPPLGLEQAGPRERLYFNPTEVTAAVVTCGGLCPGLNNVIRSLLYELHHNYGVSRLLGIRNGYLGLNPESGRPPVELTHDSVEDIHLLGGTVLGTSRGAQQPSVMVDFLKSQGISLLFCVGGDGTQRGSHAIHEEARRIGYPLSVVGIAKTIDNDVQYVSETFGFATAIECAQEVIRAAHVEARSVVNGVGLVKLMGRKAGFIAAHATLSSQEVNFCLIPEIEFPLEGEQGFLAVLERRLRDREHAVVVIAEGAGQHLFDTDVIGRDASGNRKRHDSGVFLRDRIREYCESRRCAVDVKYFDPSYSIRSVPANSRDRTLCDHMARAAVHAAMAGKTDLVIGSIHDEFVHVPIPLAVAAKKRLDVQGSTWAEVIRSTRQPNWMNLPGGA
jgi:6-phosphofructokinase 1